MVFVCFANQRGRSPEQGESADDKTNFPKGGGASVRNTIPSPARRRLTINLLHSLTSERPYTALVFPICVASRPELAEIGVPTKRRQSRFETPDANPCSPSPPKPLHD